MFRLPGIPNGRCFLWLEGGCWVPHGQTSAQTVERYVDMFVFFFYPAINFRRKKKRRKSHLLRPIPPRPEIVANELQKSGRVVAALSRCKNSNVGSKRILFCTMLPTRFFCFILRTYCTRSTAKLRQKLGERAAADILRLASSRMDFNRFPFSARWYGCPFLR